MGRDYLPAFFYVLNYSSLAVFEDKMKDAEGLDIISNCPRVYLLPKQLSTKKDSR